MTHSNLSIDQKKSLWGVEGRSIDWRLPASLFCALLISYIITHLFESAIMGFSLHFEVFLNMTIHLILIGGTIIFILKNVQARNFIHLIVFVTVLYGILAFLYRIIFPGFPLSAGSILFFFNGLLFYFIFLYLSTIFYEQTRTKWSAISIGFVLASLVSTIVRIVILISLYASGMAVIEMLALFVIESVFFWLVIWGMHTGLKIYPGVTGELLPESSRGIVQTESGKKKGGFFAPEKKGMQKGVLGGIAMMVIAAVWFFVGMAAGRIFFYPPFLFVIGLVGFIRGLVQGNIYGEKNKAKKEEPPLSNE